MTIRAKLYAAIVLTVLGPVVTIGVALAAFATLGDRFDDVARRGGDQGLALQLKFAVTDLNGWQTAYGYDGGRSRPKFEAAAASTRSLIARVDRRASAGPDRRLVVALSGAFRAFMALDRDAYRALRAGREGETKRLLLGPEIVHFETMARAADQLARLQDRRARAASREFREARRNARRQLVAVAIGAGVVIVLLLITVQDVVRLALERRSERDAA